ncbi:unnamed protein product, partial [Rotaria sp. Silwood2]
MLRIITFLVITTFAVCERQTPPSYPLWPDGFKTEAIVTAFDENNQPHAHRSLFYYAYTNDTASGKWQGQERHDHFGYCYGWA